MSTNAPGNYAPENCAICEGTGKPKGDDFDPGSTRRGYCGFCHGHGTVMVAQPSKPCPQCEGTGENKKELHSKRRWCGFCGGTGWSHRWKDK